MKLTAHRILLTKDGGEYFIVWAGHRHAGYIIDYGDKGCVFASYRLGENGEGDQYANTFDEALAVITTIERMGI